MNWDQIIFTTSKCFLVFVTYSCFVSLKFSSRLHYQVNHKSRAWRWLDLIWYSINFISIFYICSRLFCLLIQSVINNRSLMHSLPSLSLINFAIIQSDWVCVNMFAHLVLKMVFKINHISILLTILNDNRINETLNNV